MPYKIPSSLTGSEGIKSVCVYYPDNPEIKGTLLSALIFFTKWVAHERDENNTAKVVAELWYEAYLKTIETWDSECGDCGEMCDYEQIRDIIRQELDEMTINNCVTVNCGCGCGGASGVGGGIDTEPPAGYIDTPPPDMEEGTEPPPTMDYVQYLCNISHLLYYKFRTEVLIKLGSFKDGSGLDYDTVTEVLGGLQNSYGVIAAVSWEVYSTIVSWLVTRVSDSASTIALEMDRHYDEFICALYSGDGINDKRDRWLSVIDSLTLPWASRYYLKLLTQSIVWSDFFENELWQDYEFPSGYTERDCSSCAGVAIEVPDFTQDSCFVPSVGETFFFDNLLFQKYQETCPNTFASGSYNPSNGYFEFICQWDSGACTQGKFVMRTESTNDVYAWIFRELTLEGAALQNFEGVVLQEGDNGDVVWSSQTNWNPCFDALGFAPFGGVYPMNENKFDMELASVGTVKISGYAYGVGVGS